MTHLTSNFINVLTFISLIKADWHDITAGDPMNFQKSGSATFPLSLKTFMRVDCGH